MKKNIISIIGLSLLITSSLVSTPTSALGNLSYFEDMTDYANFMRIYLAICPALESGVNPTSTMPRNKQQIAKKICTSEIKEQVKRNLSFLIGINIYGSIDLKQSYYNLPGSRIEKVRAEFKDDSTKYLGFSTTVYESIGLFNADTWKLLPDQSKTTNTSVDKLLNSISQSDIQGAVDRIFNSCASYSQKDFKLCNDLLNIQEPDKNHNIFNPYNLSSIYLQQLYFNMHTNAINNGISSIPVHLTFSGFNDDFRQNILQPTLDFGNGFNFNFAEISPDTTALSKVKTHLVPGGSGFIIDQFATIATNAAEGMYTGIATWFLNIRLETISDPNVKAVWQSFRNIANVIFIIIFLMVILSQITNLGLSNYQLKRILPKMLVAIILVNLSFYITQAAVDISNLLGQGLYKILVDTSQLAGGFTDQYAVYTSKQGSIGDILNILLLIIASFLAVIATLINILLLTIRDAVVIILIITSPFALVSGLSPQLHKIHRTWWKALFNVTSIYPIASFLVGGAILVDQIIMSGQDGVIMFLTAKLALFGSLVVIPFIIINTMRKIDSAVKVGGVGSIMSSPLVHDIGSNPVDAGIKSKKLFDSSGIGQFRIKQKQQKKLFKNATRGGRFWAKTSLQAQQQLQKQRADFANNFTQQEASQIIDALYNGDDLNLPPNLRIKYQTFRDKTVSRKEIALSLAIAYTQDNTSLQQTQPATVLKAMSIARDNKATQAEMQDVTNNVMKKLDEKGDFRSIGIIKATNIHNQSYGKFDQKLLQQADQQSHKVTDPQVKTYHDLIAQHTEEALAGKGLFNNVQSGALEKLTPNTIPKNSIANEVFIKHLDTNPSARNVVLNNYHKLSADTQTILGAPPKLIDKLRQQQATINSEYENLSKDINDTDVQTLYYINHLKGLYNQARNNYNTSNEPTQKSRHQQRMQDLFDQINDEQLKLNDHEDATDNKAKMIESEQTRINSYVNSAEILKQNIMNAIKFQNDIK